MPQGRTRHLLLGVALLPVFAAFLYIAYWLRFDGNMSQAVSLAAVPFVLLIKTGVFSWFRIYQSWNRYVSFHDLVKLAEATTVSSVLVAVMDYLVFPSINIPRSVFLLDWVITLVGVGALRSIVRLIEEQAAHHLNGKAPVFIVGANDTGEALLRALRRDSRLPYRVVGFIAEDNAPQSEISGIPVLGALEETRQLARAHHVRDVFITAGELPGQQVRQLVEGGSREGVTVRVLPSYEQLLDGRVDLRPRTVSIEDLLGRVPVELNTGQLHSWLDGRTILVTGSAGSIGSEICRQLCQFPIGKLVVVDQSETGQFFLERELRGLIGESEIEVCVADVCDEPRMRSIFDQYQPHVVFHAAAYKHVPLMEANPGEAIKNIVLATRLVAELAHESGVGSFVMVSTDKAVNPTNVMGACKRVAELFVQSLARQSDCRFVTVRFGNVLDSAGSVIPVFREQIAKGGPVTVTHPDMVRYFMTIPEASQLVVQAGAMGNGGEIFVLDMGTPVKIVDLATDLIRLSGLEVGSDIEIEFTGKRPGEKLYEELQAHGETRINTAHPKILVAECVANSLGDIRIHIDQLAKLTESPRDLLLGKLRQAVPQYDPYAETDADSVRRAA